MKFPLKDQNHYSLLKILPYVLYAILPVAFIRYYLSASSPLPDQSAVIQIPINTDINLNSPISSSPPPQQQPPQQQPPSIAADERKHVNPLCDYTKGEWVPSKIGPLYNGTRCETIKDGQNCMSHGRPDVDYLYWKWQPKQCSLPRFDPEKFLNLMRNKHLAFVGDSIARNQLESLVCMLGSFSTPNLVYTSGDDNKFRRWQFPSFNFIISVYWSPFLVKGTEKSDSDPHNKLFVDSVDERWASDLHEIDMVVLSIGHWYLLSNLYYEGDELLGCHSCGNLNHTEIGFYDMYRKAYRTALKAVVERKGSEGNGTGINLMVTTFSPHHFDGPWDNAGACPKTKPYKEGQKTLEAMDELMRQIGVEQVEEAKTTADSKYSSQVRMQALDISKLSLLRPDGHPGPYMYPFPFANGVPERVHNDCVHWCLPGAIDTWNEIMLEVMQQWHGVSVREI